jgi:hypothetical protein
MIHGPTKSRRMRRVPLPERLVLELRNRIGRLVPFTETHCRCFARKVRRLSGVIAAEVRIVSGSYKNEGR